MELLQRALLDQTSLSLSISLWHVGLSSECHPLLWQWQEQSASVGRVLTVLHTSCQGGGRVCQEHPGLPVTLPAGSSDAPQSGHFPGQCWVRSFPKSVQKMIDANLASSSFLHCNGAQNDFCLFVLERSYEGTQQE